MIIALPWLQANPAVRAGLNEGDVLLALRGQAVIDIAILANLLDSETIGVSCPLTILRGTSLTELAITPTEKAIAG